MIGIMNIIICCWRLSPVEGVNALCNIVRPAMTSGRMFSPPKGNHVAKSASGSERSEIHRNGA